MQRKPIEIVAITDIPPGNYECFSTEFYNSLFQFKPLILIRNVELKDMRQFSKSYFPDLHLQLKQVKLKFKESKLIFYKNCNHIEQLRSFTKLFPVKLIVSDTLVMNIDGKKSLFFQCDIIYLTMKHAKWLGSKDYQLSLVISRILNHFSMQMGRGYISFLLKSKINLNN